MSSRRELKNINHFINAQDKNAKFNPQAYVKIKLKDMYYLSCTSKTKRAFFIAWSLDKK